MIEIKRNGQQQPAGQAQKPAAGFSVQDAEETMPSTKPALKRAPGPFTGADEKRDYKAMYRAAYSYHEAHNPPQIDREYWRTHIPEINDTPPLEVDYWQRAALDIRPICDSFNNDPFIIGLLSEVYDELSREYQAARWAASSTKNGQ